MRKTSSILYYVAPGETGSETLDHVIALARRDGSLLTLLGVMEPVSRLASFAVPSYIDLAAITEEALRSTLDALADRATAAGVPADTVVRHGRPFLEIIREVLAGEHDLVVKTAQGEGGSALGPTALHLLRKCPCPVWVIRPGVSAFERVVAAVDAGQRDEPQAGLQRRIVEIARSVGEAYDAELSVVHAWDLMAASLLGRRVSPEEMDEMMDAAEETSRRDLLALANETSVAPDALRLLKGHHGIAIAEHLRETGTDLVVLGTLSRSGVPGLLIGNTAERILKGLDCSVLAVKPEDFVTPITPPDDLATARTVGAAADRPL